MVTSGNRLRLFRTLFLNMYQPTLTASSTGLAMSDSSVTRLGEQLRPNRTSTVPHQQVVSQFLEFPRGLNGQLERPLTRTGRPAIVRWRVDSNSRECPGPP